MTLKGRTGGRPSFPAHLHLYTRTVWPTAIKFGTVTHVRRGVFVKVRHAPIPRGGASALPNFFWHHPTERSSQHGKTCWGNGVFSRFNHAIAYIAEASRGLSVTAEFCCCAYCNLCQILLQLVKRLWSGLWEIYFLVSSCVWPYVCT